MKKLSIFFLICFAIVQTTIAVNWGQYPTTNAPGISDTFLIGVGSPGTGTNMQVSAANLRAWILIPTTNAVIWTNAAIPGKALVVVGVGPQGQFIVAATNWPTGGAGDMIGANNLLDVASIGFARTNIGANNGANITAGIIAAARLGTGGTGGKFLRDDNTYQVIGGGDMIGANNGLDFASIPTTRANLGADNASNLTLGTLPQLRLPSVVETNAGAITSGLLLKSLGGSAVGGATAGTDFLAPNGNGSALTALNATQLTSGTVPMNRLSANVTTNNGNLSGVLKGDGASGATNATPGTDYLTPSGSGAALTTLNASQLTSGTVPQTRLPSTALTNFTGSLSSGLLKKGSGPSEITNATPDVDYLTPSGSAASLTALNASQLTSGTVPQGRLPSDVVTNNGELSAGLMKKGAGANEVTNATPDTDYLTPSSPLNGGNLTPGTVSSNSFTAGTLAQLFSSGGGGSVNVSSNIFEWIWGHDSGNDVQVPLSFALWAWFVQNRYVVLDSLIESTPNTNAAVMNSERFASYYGLNVPFGCDTNLTDFNPGNIFNVFSNWPTPFASGAAVDNGITKYRVRLQNAISQNKRMNLFIDGQVNVFCDFLGVSADSNSAYDSTNLLKNGCGGIFYMGCVTNTGSSFNQYTSTNATRSLVNLFGRVPTNVPQYFLDENFVTNVTFGVCPVTAPDNSPVKVMNSTGPAYDEVAAYCAVFGPTLGTTNICFDWVQVTNYLAADGANAMSLSATCNMWKAVWRTGGPTICSNALYRAFTTVHSPNINPAAFQFVDLTSGRLVLTDLGSQTRVVVNGSAAFQGVFVQDNGTPKIGFMVDNSSRGGIVIGNTLYYPHDTAGTITWTTTP